MDFNSATLQQAREAGLNDDEIYSHLGQNDTRFQDAKTQGLGLDDVAAHFDQQQALAATNKALTMAIASPAGIIAQGDPNNQTSAPPIGDLSQAQILGTPVPAPTYTDLPDMPGVEKQGSLSQSLLQEPDDAWAAKHPIAAAIIKPAKGLAAIPAGALEFAMSPAGAAIATAAAASPIVATAAGVGFTLMGEKGLFEESKKIAEGQETIQGGIANFGSAILMAFGLAAGHALAKGIPAAKVAADMAESLKQVPTESLQATASDPAARQAFGKTNSALVDQELVRRTGQAPSRPAGLTESQNARLADLESTERENLLAESKGQLQPLIFTDSQRAELDNLRKRKVDADLATVLNQHPEQTAVETQATPIPPQSRPTEADQATATESNESLNSRTSIGQERDSALKARREASDRLNSSLKAGDIVTLADGNSHRIENVGKSGGVSTTNLQTGKEQYFPDGFSEEFNGGQGEPAKITRAGGRETPAPGISEGPGAAATSEFPPQRTTSTKNAVTDAERVARGLEPIAAPARQAHGEVWEQAEQKIEQQPDHPEELIRQINSGEKTTVSPLDEAVLDYHKVTLQNEIAASGERALDPNLSEGEQQEQRVKQADLLDRMNDLDLATHATGTIWGRTGTFRQRLINDDYTLASMLQKKRVAMGGEALSEDQVSEVTKQHEDIKAKTEAETTLETQKGETESTAAADQAVKDIREKVSKTPEPRDISKEQASTIKGLKDKIDAGKNITDLRGYVQKLAEQFVRQGVKERDPLVDAVHGVLKEIIPDIERRHTMDVISGYGDFKALNPDAIKAELRDLKGQMQQVAKIEDMQKGQAPSKTGVERRVPSTAERALIKQVEELKRKGGFKVTDPATQLKSALDAIKTRLKNQIKDLGFRMETGDKPIKKEGVPYDDEAERLKAMRDRVQETLTAIEGKPEMSDAQRVKIAGDALDKQIAETQRQIKEGDLYPERAVKKTPSTPELESKRAQLEALKGERDLLRTLDTQTREFEKEQALEKSISKLEEQIKTGEVAAKSGTPTVDTESMAALKARRKELVKQREEMRAGPKKTKEEIALQAFKTRTANRYAELTDRLARGDFSTKPRAPLTLDPEAQTLKEKTERAKLDFQRALVKDRLSRRPTWEKIVDALPKWNRAFILSGPQTLLKLTSAAGEILGIAPLEEAVGSGFSKLLPGVASKAPRYGGGFHLDVEIKAVTETFKNLFKDVSDEIRTGKMDIDILHGKPETAPAELKDMIAHVHGALKSPARRNEFTRSFDQRVKFEARRGVDITDPLVQTKMLVESMKKLALNDANKSIFMEDNRVVNWWKWGLKALEQPHADKTPSFRGKVAGAAAKITVPIVKIPTNLVARTFEYSLGGLSGATRLAVALTKGLDNLKPEEADAIMRNFRRGSVGAAFMAYGYFNPDTFGGYYQQGDKRKPSDVKYGGVRVMGIDVLRVLVHNPALEQFQIGASIRRIADSKLRKKDLEKQGISPAVLGTAIGVLEETPFVREAVDVGKLASPTERGGVIGEKVKNVVIPQAVQQTAQFFDKDSKGQPIQRKPMTIGQHIESGIPYYRRNVPIRKPRR